MAAVLTAPASLAPPSAVINKRSQSQTKQQTEGEGPALLLVVRGGHAVVARCDDCFEFEGGALAS